MLNDVVEVDVKGIVPSSGGSALFLGNKDKTVLIYVDSTMGKTISMSIHGDKKERPMTHDLIASILQGLEASVERIVINDAHEATFFARLILKTQNEQGTKMVEIDARPSDCIILAVQAGRPIFIAKHVWEHMEDMTEVLEKILKDKQ